MTWRPRTGRFLGTCVTAGPHSRRVRTRATKTCSSPAAMTALCLFGTPARPAGPLASSASNRALTRSTSSTTPSCRLDHQSLQYLYSALCSPNPDLSHLILTGTVRKGVAVWDLRQCFSSSAFRTPQSLIRYDSPPTNSTASATACFSRDGTRIAVVRCSSFSVTCHNTPHTHLLSLFRFITSAADIQEEAVRQLCAVLAAPAVRLHRGGLSQRLHHEE